MVNQQVLLWKDRVAFWTLEHRSDTLIGILMEMFEQQLLFLKHSLTRALKD